MSYKKQLQVGDQVEFKNLPVGAAFGYHNKPQYTKLTKTTYHYFNGWNILHKKEIGVVFAFPDSVINYFGKVKVE